MPRYCEVALPVPLDQPFTYSVPGSLEVQPGMRVIVPFGSRKLLGVVVRCGVTPEGVEESAIRPVQEALEEDPALSVELLRLGKWLSHYYLVPEGEVLVAMLPRNPPLRSRTKVVLTTEGVNALLAPAELSASEHDLMRRIAKRKGIRRETLRDSDGVLRKLQRRGWIAYERSMEGRGRNGPRGTAHAIPSSRDIGIPGGPSPQ